MPDYDRIQFDLVIQSEKPHEFGLRQKGISGTICSWLLRDFLRIEFPYVKFDEGTVCSAGKKGWYKSDQFSPQCDIVAYRGCPWERLYEYVVIPKKNVFLTIEVKKWISLSDVIDRNEKYNKQIEKLRKFTEKSVFLVAYRTSSSIEKIKQGSVANETYIFSKSSGEGRENYPDYRPDFESNYLFKNELARLVKDISKIVK